MGVEERIVALITGKEETGNKMEPRNGSGPRR
jgi:hypothetical protein